MRSCPRARPRNGPKTSPPNRDFFQILGNNADRFFLIFVLWLGGFPAFERKTLSSENPLMYILPANSRVLPREKSQLAGAIAKPKVANVQEVNPAFPTYSVRSLFCILSLACFCFVVFLPARDKLPRELARLHHPLRVCRTTRCTVRLRSYFLGFLACAAD